MVRITAEGLADCMFVDVDGNVLDPAVTPYVLMHDPKVHDTDRPLHALDLSASCSGCGVSEHVGWDREDLWMGRAC